MDIGIFVMPQHPPERLPYDGQQWDLQIIRWGDELGFTEAWIGEHFTVVWEPNPAPDLTIAQALMETDRIRLAPGAHLLPYHHPAELAFRLAYLDHLSQGRLMVGVGAGAHQGDSMVFNIDPKSGLHREMMVEATEIITGIWLAEDEFRYEGRFWTVHVPAEIPELGYKHHIKPFQKPHPPIGIAGLSARSSTLKWGGEKGFIPLSVNLNYGFTSGHWEAYEEGAAEAGREADRRNWRVYNEVFVADTDAEAEKICLQGAMGRAGNEMLLPHFRHWDYLKHIKTEADQSVPDAEITAEYLMHNQWIVGSPDTVAEKLIDMQNQLGGFGTLLIGASDYSAEPEVMRRSMELLISDVMPQLKDYPGAAEHSLTPTAKAETS